MVRLVDHEHGGTTGVGPRDLDGVLHGFGAGAEQRGALVEVAGCVLVQPLRDADEALVLGHHEARVREPVELRGDLGAHDRVRRPHTGHRDAGCEVDEGVPVDVLERRGAGSLDEDREGDAEAGGDGGFALGMELA